MFSRLMFRSPRSQLLTYRPVERCLESQRLLGTILSPSVAVGVCQTAPWVSLAVSSAHPDSGEMLYLSPRTLRLLPAFASAASRV